VDGRVRKHVVMAAQRTLKDLTNLGFDEGKAKEALKAIGNPGDKEAAINWLLDHGEEDRGGTVELKHCPHVEEFAHPFAPVKLLHRSSLCYSNKCVAGCPGTENWYSLLSGETRCGRYSNKCSLKHWEKTKRTEEATLTVADAAEGKEAFGNCLVLGLSDLTVWCYECQAYVDHEMLTPLLKQMEALKFGRSVPGAIEAPSSASSAPMVEGAPMCGVSMEAMHGRYGDASWAAPHLARCCEDEARPGYKTKKAHEYLDHDDVLQAKVRVLADLIRRSQNCVAYTGAGISTASGIKDYASKAKESVAINAVTPKKYPLVAKPTFAHHVLVKLYYEGLLKHWVQQNHDGLPQKAGYPQQELNEIHGAWFDPSNPVVPMSGTLRDDLMSRLLAWETRCDLCLAMGTSMVGMNSDRMAISAAQRAKAGKALGTVIVALQQTQYDSSSSLRIFAPIDRVMQLLSSELDLNMTEMVGMPQPVLDAKMPDVYRDLPYDKNGLRSDRSRITLDLREGAQVRLVNQQSWDQERWGNEGVVTSPHPSLKEEGHYAIAVGEGSIRVLGRWWIAAAQRGEVEALPVVN